MHELYSALTQSHDARLILIAVATGVVACIAVYFLGHRRELRRLRLALDAMPDGLALFDAKDRLVAWNTRYEVLRHGLPVYRGQPYMEILRQGLSADLFVDPDTDKEAWLAERLEVRRGGGFIDVPTFDGRWMRCSERHTARGGRVTVYSDITDLKNAEETLARANGLAREADRIKSEFLANMSHEIRTPMNGIIGMNSLMLMSDLTPTQKRYAEVVQTSAEGLMTIFNDILDVARLEAGAVEIARLDFDLDELLAAVEGPAREDAYAKGLAFDVRAGAGPWPNVIGDAARLRQVLVHLVDNAVKFTDAGRVAVEVRRKALSSGRTAIRIEVIDTGPGVPQELQSALFEPFRQADGGATRRHGGAGLGLAICRHTVHLMGGGIGVADRPEGGAIFWVELTLPNAPQAASAAAAQAAA
jgi:signal transduction histidine kinase